MEPRPGKADVKVVRFTPTEEGVHAINVSYDGHAVPGSPFPVDAQLPPDPSKVVILNPFVIFFLSNDVVLLAYKPGVFVAPLCR